MRSPCITTSSPVLTMTVTSCGGTARASPRRNLPAPMPPASAATLTFPSHLHSGPAPRSFRSLREPRRGTPSRTSVVRSPLYGSPGNIGAVADVVLELAIAEAGRRRGCKEALFTLGDRPEDRYDVAREWLTERGFRSTLEYVRAAAIRVIEETGLLPHLNLGLMSYEELARLKHVSASMGLMLETSSARLSERGGPHFGSPDKVPAVRLRTIEDAGRLAIPFTTGILVGIGETARERAESLFAIRDLHRRYGHVQEVIVQNFLPKPGTAMRDAAPPEQEEYLAAVATTRIVMGPRMSVQAPPNLSDVHGQRRLLAAGVDDWGGVSPLTPDHVNPERPWPALEELAAVTAEAGYDLVQRLTAQPKYVQAGAAWIDPRVRGTGYAELVRAVKARVPSMHVHAFSPMEIASGVTKSGLSIREWLIGLREAGLDTIPGTAAEILDDEVRWVLTKGKLPTSMWIDIVTTAHEVGLRSSSTMMYGHVDDPRHWVAHLNVLRDIQDRTGGFTEFVPLPFVHQSSPLYLARGGRPGPTHRDNRAVHALARIMLHGRVSNIQTSWVKLGVERTQVMLNGGANDLGGTLMEETISRMAGSEYGSAKTVAELTAIAEGIGRPARQRTTTYMP